jgi:hypothetical protein
LIERQYLAACKDWTYACINAIAEAFAESEIILQEKQKRAGRESGIKNSNRTIDEARAQAG